MTLPLLRAHHGLRLLLRLLLLLLLHLLLLLLLAVLVLLLLYLLLLDNFTYSGSKKKGTIQHLSSTTFYSSPLTCPQTVPVHWG